MNVPEDLRYTPEHEWARVGGDGLVTMGITDYAQDALGDVVYISLPAAGIQIHKDGVLGEVESTKSVSEIYAPCGGEVVEANAVLAESPERINEDPYGDGWIARIRPVDAAELETLLDAAGYRAITEPA